MIFIKKHKIIIIVIIFITTFYGLTQKFTLKPYNELLNADRLHIYKGDELVANIANPSSVLDLYNDAVGVAITNYSCLGIEQYNMRELYRFEFFENDKTISCIKMMTPKNQEAIDDIIMSNSAVHWKDFNGSYVILTENFQYFSFGNDFYNKIIKILYD